MGWRGGGPSSSFRAWPAGEQDDQIQIGTDHAFERGRSLTCWPLAAAAEQGRLARIGAGSAGGPDAARVRVAKRREASCGPRLEFPPRPIRRILRLRRPDKPVVRATHPGGGEPGHVATVCVFAVFFGVRRGVGPKKRGKIASDGAKRRFFLDVFRAIVEYDRQVPRFRSPTGTGRPTGSPELCPRPLDS